MFTAEDGLDRCESCAVVLSSGTLLGSGSGKVIDANDCVARFNDAPVVGFEQDVGSKSTHRLLGLTGARQLALHKDIIQHNELLIYIRMQHREKLDKPPGLFPGKALIFMDPSLEQSAKDHVGKYLRNSTFFDHGRKTNVTNVLLLTAGFVGIWLMKNVCDTVTVFGMNFQDDCSNLTDNHVPYHYYKREYPTGKFTYCRQMKDTPHSMHLEHFVLQDLEKTDEITIFRP